MARRAAWSEASRTGKARCALRGSWPAATPPALVTDPSRPRAGRAWTTSPNRWRPLSRVRHPLPQSQLGSALGTARTLESAADTEPLTEAARLTATSPGLGETLSVSQNAFAVPAPRLNVVGINPAGGSTRQGDAAHPIRLASPQGGRVNVAPGSLQASTAARESCDTLRGRAEMLPVSHCIPRCQRTAPDVCRGWLSTREPAAETSRFTSEVPLWLLPVGFRGALHTSTSSRFQPLPPTKPTSRNLQARDGFLGASWKAIDFTATEWLTPARPRGAEPDLATFMQTRAHRANDRSPRALHDCLTLANRSRNTGGGPRGGQRYHRPEVGWCRSTCSTGRRPSTQRARSGAEARLSLFGPLQVTSNRSPGWEPRILAAGRDPVQLDPRERDPDLSEPRGLPPPRTEPSRCAGLHRPPDPKVHGEQRIFAQPVCAWLDGQTLTKLRRPSRSS